MIRQVALFCFLLVLVESTVYFEEQFPKDDSLKDWVKSTHHSDVERGQFALAKSVAWDEGELGLKTEEDSRFYGISKKIPEAFSNEGKTLVLQYMVKYEKTVSCGGAYIKLLPDGTDSDKFHGESPYNFMFGPDICGYSTKKVHAIFNYKGKQHLIKKDVPCKDDLLSHLYTFILTPDNKYKILIDNEEVAAGSLEDDWDMLPAKQIDDPEAKKPEDWVDEADMIDEADTKPEDWDQPKTVPDSNAKKPEDWDDEMDGDWERPQVDNPEYKGDWKPKRIPNPAYKGPWTAPKIDNPEFKQDPDMYVMKDIGMVGFELWQVVAGSIFDNILVTDDVEFAHAEGERLWRPRFEAEKEKKKLDDEKEEEERKAAAKEVEEKKAAAGDKTENEEESSDDDDDDGETPQEPETNPPAVEEIGEPKVETHEEL